MESELHVTVFKDLGPTLEDVFNAAGQNLSMNIIAVLAEKLVRTETR